MSAISNASKETITAPESQGVSAAAAARRRRILVNSLRILLGSIFVIALGLGYQSKVALAAVMVFFIVFYNAFQGVREVDRNLLANARILGANQRQLSTAVVIPSALTWITASLHTSFSFALVGAVVGEFLGATQGIGLMIQTAQGTFNANGIFAAMVILVVLALLAEFLITALENRLISWRPNTISDWRELTRSVRRREDETRYEKRAIAKK